MAYVAEERQDQNAKRRKIEKEKAANRGGPAAYLNGGGAPTAPSSAPTPGAAQPPPAKKSAGNDFAAKADSIGLGGPKTVETEQFAGRAAQAWAGSNHDVVANRRAIRMANMSAAEVLKAELAGLTPVKPSANSFSSASTPAVPTPNATADGDVPPAVVANMELSDEGTDIPGLGVGPDNSNYVIESMDVDEDRSENELSNGVTNGASLESPHGTKRKHEVAEAEDEEVEAAEGDVTIPVEEDDDDDANAAVATNYALKVNADGTVDQEDTVR